MIEYLFNKNLQLIWRQMRKGRIRRKVNVKRLFVHERKTFVQVCLFKLHIILILIVFSALLNHGGTDINPCVGNLISGQNKTLFT